VVVAVVAKVLTLLEVLKWVDVELNLEHINANVEVPLLQVLK
jgi:hypothetical protein